MNDPRQKIYQDLHGGQLSQQEQNNRHSALHILGLVRQYLQPKSILDVGCGLGTWLSAAQSLGIADIFGVEGPWADPKTIAIDQKLVKILDLEKPIALGRRFDLALCLEIGEHLSPAAAPSLVQSLVSHADVVLFSAAIPHQGGAHHVNEQFPDYWAPLFAKYGYHVVDCIRPKIWYDREILWWLRQNILFFVSEKALAGNEKLRLEKEVSRPLSIVHPDVYLSRLQTLGQMEALARMVQESGLYQVTRNPQTQQIHIAPMEKGAQILAEHQQMMEFLKAGGTFKVKWLPDGRLNMEKVGE